MHRNWFTSELKYQVWNQGFTVDIRNHNLIPYQPYYSVKPEVRFRDQVLHQQKDGYSYTDGCISHSREHFAYFVRIDKKVGTPTVFAKTKDMKQPVVVAEVPFYTTLVTWIEDTSSLRKEQPNNRMKTDE